ncbi:MAG: SLC13 family permease [Kiritimatiellia bacterium]
MITTLIVFLTCYVFFVLFPNRRSWVACGGAVVLVATGWIDWQTALFEKINWNVMGLFVGTMVLAELFMLSRGPAVIAEWLVDRTKSARTAMLVICALAGGISTVVENVAVVLLLAPVVFSLAEKLKTSPVPLMVGVAISSNLQGTATMIGDPPSMILAGHMKMGFFDFFVWREKPSIFFAVEIGALASLGVLAWFFKKHREPASVLSVEKVLSWVPGLLLVILILGLSFATLLDPEFRWFVGTYALVVGCVGLGWFVWRARWCDPQALIKGLDWDTAFFLAGVFILVGSVSDSGWLDRLAGILVYFARDPAVTFILITLLAVIFSGFVDNVPFLVVMIPVVETVALQTGAPTPLFLFGLLVGACLGGNLTPIGASANVVALGMLKKRGHPVSFWQFMRIGIPFTAAAVLSASLFVWWVWKP